MIAHTGVYVVYLSIDTRDVLSVFNVQLNRILLGSPAQNEVNGFIDSIHIVAYWFAKILYDVVLH
jgi:hypothetical protein